MPAAMWSAWRRSISGSRGREKTVNNLQKRAAQGCVFYRICYNSVSGVTQMKKEDYTMKKLLSVLLAVMLLCSAAAFAEDAEPIRIGQVQYAAHGTSCFAVITAVVQGDVILAAHIDEYQYISDREDIAAIGVPNSDQSFGANYPEGKVLGSKRANNELYSLNMQRAGSTVQLLANYQAIEAYVAGKTIAELEEATGGVESADFVDAVSGATLADSLGYVKGIIEAAKAAGAQTGTYTIYNVTGENVTELYLADTVTGEQGINYAVNGFAADACMVITKTIPAGEDGHHRLNLTFKTESGYEGSFPTLSIEVAPISLLSADAMTGATQISFKAPPKVQTGKYTIYNLTGETVKAVTITDNVTGDAATGGPLDPDGSVEMTFSIPEDEDGHGRLTLTFETESGYQGSFTTLSIEEAPISLLAQDAMTGATQISFTAPAAQ